MSGIVQLVAVGQNGADLLCIAGLTGLPPSPLRGRPLPQYPRDEAAVAALGRNRLVVEVDDDDSAVRVGDLPAGNAVGEGLHQNLGASCAAVVEVVVFGDTLAELALVCTDNRDALVRGIEQLHELASACLRIELTEVPQDVQRAPAAGPSEGAAGVSSLSQLIENGLFPGVF